MTIWSCTHPQDQTQAVEVVVEEEGSWKAKAVEERVPAELASLLGAADMNLNIGQKILEEAATVAVEEIQLVEAEEERAQI